MVDDRCWMMMMMMLDDDDDDDDDSAGPWMIVCWMIFQSIYGTFFFLAHKGRYVCLTPR